MKTLKQKHEAKKQPLDKQVKKFLKKYWSIDFENDKQNRNMLSDAVDLILGYQEEKKLNKSDERDDAYLSKYLSYFNNAKTKKDKLAVLDSIYADGFQDGAEFGND